MMTPTRHKLRKYVCSIMLMLLVCLGILLGPAATSLQMRAHWTQETNTVEVVYLVCGARAQQRRLQALQTWLKEHQSPETQIWIGNDTQNSLWSRTHQRNLTRAEWAYEFTTKQLYEHTTKIVEGDFSNTDGEMMALGVALRQAPEIQTIALVTCGFHARRTVKRFTTHAPDTINIKVIPVVPYWENRAPWIVAAEWLKMLRDFANLTHHPWLSRQP